jgi:hypothetical protein
VCVCVCVCVCACVRACVRAYIYIRVYVSKHSYSFINVHIMQCGTVCRAHVNKPIFHYSDVCSMDASMHSLSACAMCVSVYILINISIHVCIHPCVSAHMPAICVHIHAHTVIRIHKCLRTLRSTHITHMHARAHIRVRPSACSHSREQTHTQAWTYTAKLLFKKLRTGSLSQYVNIVKIAFMTYSRISMLACVSRRTYILNSFSEVERSRDKLCAQLVSSSCYYVQVYFKLTW